MAAHNTAPPGLLLRQAAAQLHSTDGKCAADSSANCATNSTAHGSADCSAHRSTNGATDSAANGSADC